jgi:hypothetical protein
MPQGVWTPGVIYPASVCGAGVTTSYEVTKFDTDKMMSKMLLKFGGFP